MAQRCACGGAAGKSAFRMLNSSDIFDARILIVDDHEGNLEVMGQILRSAGYTSIVLTSDSRAVCDLHRKDRYALIILDLDRPAVNGFQVMEGIGKIESDDGNYLPVFVITANPGAKLLALERGAKDFLSKPVDPPEMIKRVYNLLEVRLLHDEARDQSRKLKAVAWNDPLTGLGNRRLLDDRLGVALAQARRNKGIVTVMYLDLDEFKNINDTMGHGAGDTLLQAVAGRLSRTVRESDTVARVGGDEFVILFRHIGNGPDVPTLAAKLIKAVSQPYHLAGGFVDVTASVGIASYPYDGEDSESLLISADKAMYDAKQSGKNNFQITARSRDD